MLGRLLVLGALGVSGILLVRFTPVGDLLNQERLPALFAAFGEKPWAPAALILAYCVIAPVGLPATPFVVSGGLVFGPLLGGAYNTLGLVGGAMISYWVGKAMGREAVVQLAGPRLRRAEKLFERRGFWPLVQIRFLPLPFALVGYAAALAGVPTGRYFVTSTLGLMPSAFAHTYFAPALINAALAGERPYGLVVAYGAVLLSFNLIVGWPQVRSALARRRRYRELKAIRDARRPNGR